MSVRDELEKQILAFSKKEFSEREILAYLNMRSGFDKEQVNIVLKNLIAKGKIMIVAKKKYKKTIVNKASKKFPDNNDLRGKEVIEGVLRGNPKGFAFVISEGADDLFIPHKSLNGAMHKDTVLAEKISNGAEKPEGRVLRIIERGMQTVIGTFKSEKNYGFVVPDVKDYFNDIFIPERYKRKAKDGDKVVAKITEYYKTKNPEGQIEEILGKGGNPKTDVLSIIRSYGFYETDRTAQSDAELIEKNGISSRELANRRDFTKLLTITIDGDDSKDFDDAISLERSDKGYVLYVHIADVSQYVCPGTLIDDEAYDRSTSVYFPSSVLPMIPEALSNGLCSLSEGNIRLTLTCVITLNNRGKVTSNELVKSYIKSDRRMTYDNVTKILNGDKELTDKYKDIRKMLFDMQALALVLSDLRVNRGSIDFGNNECKIILDNKLNVEKIVPYEYTVSNKIIEEFMILANETVAEFFARMEYPFVYRIHETPDSEKLKNFIDFAKACGFNLKVNGELSSYHFQKLLNEAKGTEYEKIINKVMLRTMQKAKYSVENKGHFGLCSDYYCHFTSPIRRYADLTVHRVVKEFLDGKIDRKKLKGLQSMCEKTAVKASEREIAAEQAERDADDYFKARYMADKLGEVYEGTISGVTQFGVFVELDNTVEGMIKYEDLIGNNLEYSEKKYTIKGDGVIYKLGERLSIVVANSDIETKKIRFTLNTAKQK